MENASKALLMAAGILIGILILTLMVTLFIGSKEVSNEYQEKKHSELVQQFNVNFTKYLGRQLTIHDVVSICEYAKINNVKVTGAGSEKTVNDIKQEVQDYSNDLESIPKYTLTITEYKNGYISEINIDYID